MTQPLLMKKLTPVILVEEIEPCLPFWVERLGFAKTAEVPEGEKLGFVMLAKDGVQVMYQSRASVAKDVPALAQGEFRPTTGLFVEVSNLKDVIAKMKGAEVVVPERTTFYGAHELGVREPGGSVVIFAEFAEQPK